MLNKTIIALACVLIASPAFAQTAWRGARYYRTTTAVTTSEPVTVTAPHHRGQRSQRRELPACWNPGRSHGQCESGAF